jgi:hypothetical protein
MLLCRFRILSIGFDGNAMVSKRTAKAISSPCYVSYLISAKSDQGFLIALAWALRSKDHQPGQ